jgi:hypothetical protein
VNLLTLIMNTIFGGGCTSEDGNTYYGADSTITYNDDGDQECSANED